MAPGGNRALALVLLVASAPAVGQVAKPPTPWLGIRDIGGKISFSGEYRAKDQRNSDTGFTLRQEKALYEEQIRLDAEGHVYHPNLVEWFGSFGVRWTQNREDVNQDNFDSDGDTLNYDVSTTVFREKPITFRYFANDWTQDLNQVFSGAFRLRTRSQGGEILVKSPLPMSLRMECIRRDEKDETRREKERTEHLKFRISDPRDRDRLTEFTYERQDTFETADVLDQAGQRVDELDLSFVRDELTAFNVWRFGPEDRPHVLSGRARLLRRTGFYANDVFSAHQRLTLAHTDTFSTFYLASYNDNRTDIDEDREVEGEVGFTKAFYESLDVTGRLFGSDREFTDGTEDMWGASIETAYRKHTPLGQYRSRLLLAKECETEKSEAGQRRIRDESVVLTSLTFARLSEPGVLPQTILVTNTTRTTIYVEGADYRVRTTGVFAEIARIATGQIGNGQTVLVDYVIVTGRNADFTTDRVVWNNRFQFKHVPLSVYVDYDLNDMRLQSGDDPGNLDKEETWLTGAEVAYKGLTFSVEREVVDQQLSPPTSETRFEIDYQQRFGRASRLSLSGRVSRLRYHEAERFGLEERRSYENACGARAQVTTKLARAVLLRVDADYTRSRGRNDIQLIELGAVLEWKFHNLDFSIEARQNEFLQESTSGRERYVFLKVSRRF